MYGTACLFFFFISLPNQIILGHGDWDCLSPLSARVEQRNEFCVTESKKIRHKQRATLRRDINHFIDLFLNES